MEVPPATHPFPNTHSTPSHLSNLYTFHFIYYSGCEKSCSKSSSASQLEEIVIKHQLKDCSSYTAYLDFCSYSVYLAWLQSSTRKPQCFQYLKLGFLKIPNVTIRSVFENQVIYIKHSYLFLIHYAVLMIRTETVQASIFAASFTDKVCSVVQKIFAWNYFVAINIGEKNFRGFPVPTKIF